MSHATSLFIATSEGTLIVKDVRDEDGQSLIKQLKIGDRFFTPYDVLKEAMQYRAVYIPQTMSTS